MKVVSVRINEDLLKEIEGIIWWDNFPNKSECLKTLLNLGIREWKRKKLLNPDMRLDITIK